ncbi:hypothetical protein ACFW04_007456 [Cataglyphis niger]
MLRCYTFSIFFYGWESWTLDPIIEKFIEAFEMYLYRWILRISWTQRITNVEVLNRMRKQKELLFTIKTRKIHNLGHIMRGEKYELLRLIIEEKIIEKVYRQKTKFLVKESQTIVWMHMWTYLELQFKKQYLPYGSSTSARRRCKKKLLTFLFLLIFQMLFILSLSLLLLFLQSHMS